ncbi:MAG: hypothetical protein JXB49_11615 [Bacteroidales bacterium]|nr:hypothetical protein [Bacteroidales bacterium]
MWKFIKKSLFFITPFCTYLVLILLIDPYSYYGYSVISIDKKSDIACSVEPHLYQILHFQNAPTHNILLGDSRTNALAKQFNPSEWSNLSYGGGSIKEIIQTFWFASKTVELDTVIIGINFNLYNAFNKSFWVEETLERTANFFSYSTNKYVFESSLLIIKNLFVKDKIERNKPNMSKKDFWDFQLNRAKMFYEKYAYPDYYSRELAHISEYCKTNGIKLIFYIPPTHIELQKRVKDFHLEKYEFKFKEDLAGTGTVYDFDYPNDITKNKDNFEDPFHFNDSIAKIVKKEITTGKVIYSIKN